MERTGVGGGEGKEEGERPLSREPYAELQLMT